MKYKSLSIKLPWADLIAQGKKTIEVRSWKTSYRGDLLICASKTPKGPGAGMALCLAELYNVRQSIPYDDDKRACCEPDYDDFSWELRNIRTIQPFQVKGKLNIYEVEVPDGVIIL